MKLAHTVSYKDWVVECSLDSSGGVLAGALSSCEVKLMDAGRLTCVSTLGPSSPAGPPPTPGSQRVCSGAWGGEGAPTMYYLACGSSDSWDEGVGKIGAPSRTAMVYGFDTRTGRAAQQWDLSAAAKVAGELGAMAMSTSGTLLAAGLGSEVHFFDARKGSGGGGGGGNAAAAAVALDTYTSHSEPVTSISWHPTLARHTLSASEDGLVNVYDSGIAGEEDALVSTLSIGGSVSHFGVFGPSGALAHVATRTGELSLWNIGGAEKLAEFAGMRGEGMDFLLSAHYHPGKDTLTALAGGHNGDITLLDVTLSGCGVVGGLHKGHKATPRCAAMSTWDTGVVFTGGEDGRVCAWVDPGRVVGRGEGRVKGGKGGGEGKSKPWGDEAALFGKTRLPPGGRKGL
jgi:hypothetical protein